MARKLKRWISSLLAAAVAVSVMPMGGIAVFGSQEREASYASGGGVLGGKRRFMRLSALGLWH